MAYNTAVSRISPASGVIHFCLPCPGSGLFVTWITPKRSRTWTSRVTALLSRFSFFASKLIEVGVSLEPGGPLHGGK
jgi:hypothetical protein